MSRGRTGRSAQSSKDAADGAQDLSALPGLAGSHDAVADRLYSAALDAAFPLRRDGDHAALLRSLDPSRSSPAAAWDAVTRLLDTLVALDARCAKALRDAE